MRSGKNDAPPLNNVELAELRWINKQRQLLEINGNVILHNKNFLRARRDVYKDLIRQFRRASLTPDEKISYRLLKATLANTRQQLYPTFAAWAFGMIQERLMSIAGFVGRKLQARSQRNDPNIKKSPAESPPLHYATSGMRAEQPAGQRQANAVKVTTGPDGEKVVHRVSRPAVYVQMPAAPSKGKNIS